MVEVGTGDKDSRFLKTQWPITDGITAGTTKHDDHEVGSGRTVNQTTYAKDRVGID